MKKHILLSVVSIFIFHCCSFGQGSTYSGPYTASAPIALSGKSNQTINMLKITNPTGHCITLVNCSNMTIQNCKLGPSKGEGIYLSNCTNITVTNCSMDSIESGVVADVGSGIKVLYNDVKNVQGPMPRGQMVQYGNVSGTGNSISYNVGENIAGQSFPEDEISLFESNGTPADPIKIIGNWIRGGGPSTSGGGIMTGDMGGSNVLVENNILVNPGQYGITISSGDHISIKNNMIFSCKLPFSNIGLSAYKQYDITTTADTIMNNQVNFTNNAGQLNCLWNAGNCGVVVGWDTNMHDPDLNANILPAKIIGRAKGVTTGTVSVQTSSGIKIYPNPASDHLMIETAPDVKNGIVEIYNINGQKMLVQTITDNLQTINTGNLSSAVYILKITGDNNLMETRKITIARN